MAICVSLITSLYWSRSSREEPKPKPKRHNLSSELGAQCLGPTAAAAGAALTLELG